MTDEQTTAIITYEATKANSTTIWVLFLFLGWSFGSLDELGKQIAYYLTLGGFGLWVIIRLFTLNGAIKDYNRKKAILAGLDNKSMIAMGLV
ncbi:MAG: hypothetical protein ACI9GM_000745 [Salibacteraceae bacterium]|jgi:hypothetical protein